MISKYRCETCKFDKPDTGNCPTNSNEAHDISRECGLTCHSDFVDAIHQLIPMFGTAIQIDVSGNKYVMLEDIENTIDHIICLVPRKVVGKVEK